MTADIASTVYTFLQKRPGVPYHASIIAQETSLTCDQVQAALCNMHNRNGVPIKRVQRGMYVYDQTANPNRPPISLIGHSGGPSGPERNNSEEWAGRKAKWDNEVRAAQEEANRWREKYYALMEKVVAETWGDHGRPTAH